MTFQEFDNEIRGTLAKYIRDKDQIGRYIELVWGLFEEGGESATIIRRSIKGNFHERPIDLEHLTEEIGDVLFYTAQITYQLPGTDLESVVKSNLAKKHAMNEKELDESQLTIKNYQQCVANTYGNGLPKSKNERGRFLALVLISEIGGVTQLFGKHILNGIELDASKVKESLGDCLWHTVALSDNYGLDFEEIAKAAIEKAQSRYDKNGMAKPAKNAEER